MADQEQLRILKENGVESWNEWRKNNPIKEINLHGADLDNLDLRGANLSTANLSNANLCYTTIFNGSHLRASDLRGANLSYANLSNANLSSAKLRCANLTAAQVLKTNLKGATLTGANIEDWNINSETTLDSVFCDYIFLKSWWNKDNVKYVYFERRPSDPNKNFEPGEFAALVQKSVETVDLVFKQGIDWKALLSSVQDLRVEYGEQNVSIQAIEQKSGGAFVIRLNVPPEVNKAEVESKAKESYETKIKVLEARNDSLLRENANLNNIVYTLASRSITVEAKAIAESKSMSDTFNNDLKGANIANYANKLEGNARQQANQYNYASKQKQTLAETAEEVQNLLKQLEQTNPTATEDQQIEHLNDETTPKFKRKAVAALKAAGNTALDEFLDNSYVKVAKAAIIAELPIEKNNKSLHLR